MNPTETLTELTRVQAQTNPGVAVKQERLIQKLKAELGSDQKVLDELKELFNLPNFEQAIRGTRTTDEIDNLIETLEILRDAIRAKDHEKGFEAVTIFLMQFMSTFGHDRAYIGEVFPFLEQLKDQIESRNFAEAEVGVLAWLARVRQLKENLATRMRK